MSTQGLERAVDLASGPSPLAVLAFRGADAARYLQGQVSAEIEKLAPGSSTLAGYHNPQGRVIALLALTRVAPEEFLAVLPRELSAGVAQRLGKYVLRARVRITEESQSWRVLGVNHAAAPGEMRPPASPAIRWGSRQIQLLPVGESGAGVSDPVVRSAWERADVAAGLPQVYAATSESFVAQMLNLDLLGAIAFDKGCYTGQEVIARAHYRGRVKRRLQRWHNLSGTRLEPGQPAQAPDGRPLIVVRVAPDGEIAQDVLAVGNYSTAEASAEGAESAETGAAAGPRVSGPLSLPYPLPT